MKKILKATSAFMVAGMCIFFTGCNSELADRVSKLESRVESLENERMSSNTGVENKNVENTETTDNSLDILSFTLQSQEPWTSSIKHTYNVVNNGKTAIESLSIDVAYYDANGNCIDTDSRFKEIVVEPGKSVLVDSFGGDESTLESIVTSKVISYEYRLIEPNANGNNEIEVNCETGKISEDFDENS